MRKDEKEFICRDGSLHNGNDAWRSSHGVMQSTWKRCLQGNYLALASRKIWSLHTAKKMTPLRSSTERSEGVTLTEGRGRGRVHQFEEGGMVVGTKERRGKEREGHTHIAFVAPVGLRFWPRRRRHWRCFPLRMIINLKGRHPLRLHEPAQPPEMISLFTTPLCQQKMEETDDAQTKGNQTKEDKLGLPSHALRFQFRGKRREKFGGKGTVEIANERNLG
ncbi:hypothetical protein LR48_Vigan02g105700 [Vigna angularis]|uniref:Uncharacterized protein n=1 Tax=Phaseolus angularis TaxID=3914 RepID=A0A0L9TWV8_PHAAN|nr:hypothetical protein LR48_Vigan02g105700 [Vigna angularis]